MYRPFYRLFNSNPHPTGWPNERLKDIDDAVKTGWSGYDSLRFWHGSPSGEWHPKTYGIHIGSKLAAREALEAKIGVRADGKDWDGTQEYGKSKLAGQESLERIEKERGGAFLRTGHNAGGMGYSLPKNDYYPGEYQHKAAYSDGSPIPSNAKPNIFPVKIVGEMTNRPWSPMSDTRANAQMAGQQKKGNAKRGYYYKNDAEDEGSVSAVVPAGTHLQRL